MSLITLGLSVHRPEMIPVTAEWMRKHKTIFHPETKQPEREALLAARALIYSKLIVKEELTGRVETLPHLHDEWACIERVGRLTLDDGRRLFPLFRKTNTATANQIVSANLSDSRRQQQGDDPHLERTT